MKAYETSAKALGDLLSHPSLQSQNVEQTMSRLADTLADHAEIEQTISINGAQAVEVDDDELEVELRALIKEITPPQEESRISLPSPPLAEPVGSKMKEQQASKPLEVVNQ